MRANAPESVLGLLSDEVTRSVFQMIATNRAAQFKDIRQSLGADQTGGLMIVRDVERAVEALKEASLIQERVAPIRDFSTYFVTAEGLTAERKLRMFDGGHAA